MAARTNLSQILDTEYQQRGAAFFTDASNNQLTPEAAKAKLRDEMKHETALVEARRAAIDFATQLEQMPIKPNSQNPSENLESLAALKGLQAKVSEPFAQGEEPRGLNVPSQLSRVAFSLTLEEPNITEPVVGEDAAYVFSFKRKIPSNLPPLEAIKDQVTQDYQRSEALRLSREAAQSFVAAATNAISSGKTFDSAAQQLGHAVIDIAPFPRESRSAIEALPPQVDAASLRNSAFNTPAGHISAYIPGRDGGYVVFVEKFIPATPEEVKTGLPDSSMKCAVVRPVKPSMNGSQSRCRLPT